MKNTLRLAALAASLPLFLMTVAHADNSMPGMDMPGMDMSGGAKADADGPDMAPVQIGVLSLTHGYVKGMLPGQAVAGGSVTISNAGAVPDRLVSVSSPIADHVEIHEMTMDKDVMRMRQLKDGIALAPGETVDISAGGMHLMFMGVKTPVRTGASVKATFTFEKSGSVDAVLPVVDPRKASAGGHKHKS